MTHWTAWSVITGVLVVDEPTKSHENTICCTFLYQNKHGQQPAACTVYMQWHLCWKGQEMGKKRRDCMGSWMERRVGLYNVQTELKVSELCKTKLTLGKVTNIKHVGLITRHAQIIFIISSTVTMCVSTWVRQCFLAELQRRDRNTKSFILGKYWLDLSKSDCWSLVLTSDKLWNTFLHRTKTADCVACLDHWNRFRKGSFKGQYEQEDRLQQEELVWMYI